MGSHVTHHPSPQVIACSEKEIDIEIAKHHKCSIEIEEIKKNFKQNKNSMNPSDSVKYETLIKDLSNSLNLLLKNEYFFTQFRNNQVINALTLNSFKLLTKAFKKPEQKRIFLSWLVQLLNQTIKEDNREWFENAAFRYIQSTERNLIDLLNDKEMSTCYSFRIDIFEFINLMFELVPIDQLVNLQITDVALNSLQKYADDSNIHIVIKTLNTALSRISDKMLFDVSPLILFNMAEYISMIIDLKNLLLLLMTDYENELIKWKNNIIENLLFVLENAFKEVGFKEVDVHFYELYDKYIQLLNEQIENYPNIDEQKILYYRELSNGLTDSKFKDMILVNGRNEFLLELMVKIILKSNNFEIFKNKDYQFLDMAFDTIESILNRKNTRIKFSYFYQKYWPLIESSWTQILKHERGHIALKIWSNFSETYESSQFDQLVYYINSVQSVLLLKEQRLINEIDEESQYALIDIMRTTKKMENFECLYTYLGPVFESLFTIEKRLDFNKWNSSFSMFNSLLFKEKFEFFFGKKELVKTYFEMIMKRLKIDEKIRLENVTLKPRDFVCFHFINEFVEVFKQDLNNDHKTQINQYIDFYWNMLDSWDKNIAGKVIERII